MLVVKFIKGYKSYVAGDIAGFKQDEVDFLVRKNLAEPIGEVGEVDNTPKIDVDCDFNFGKKMPKLSAMICAVCGKEYKTKRGVKQHLWKAHKIKK